MLYLYDGYRSTKIGDNLNRFILDGDDPGYLLFGREPSVPYHLFEVLFT